MTLHPAHPGRYPEQLIAPMRRDLTQYGVEEARTPQEVDEALQNETVLLVINSVCGCAAGKARPAVGLALSSGPKPVKAITVFAGADLEAVAYLRTGKLSQVPPSSPSMVLFRGGEPVYLLHRRDIESSDAETIADRLSAAFERFCVQVPSQGD